MAGFQRCVPLAWTVVCCLTLACQRAPVDSVAAAPDQSHVSTTEVADAPVKSPGREPIAAASAASAATPPAAGVSGAESSPSASSQPATEADGVLKRMAAAYRAATSYADQGKVVLRMRHGGEWTEDAAPFRVVWQRPNRLRMECYQAVLVSDGSQVWGVIRDPNTNDLDHQVLSKLAPAQLQLTELYADRILYGALASGLGRQPVQADLLLGATPLESLFDPRMSKQLRADGLFDGRPCRRVAVTTDEGEFVFWIDTANSILRKLEYPVRAALPELAHDPQVSGASLTAEFRDAAFDQDLPRETFQFRPPENARLVRAFVPPPPPLPSELLGKRPRGFQFAKPTSATAAAQQQYDQAALDGRIAALLWFNLHPACAETLRQFSEVGKQYADQPKLTFLAVATEPAHTTDQQLDAVLQSRGTAVPWARDLAAHGRDLFAIPWAPTLIVLDAAGLVQVYAVGANTDLAAQLPPLLDRLLKGDNLATEVRALHDKERAQYEELLRQQRGSNLPDGGSAAL